MRSIPVAMIWELFQRGRWYLAGAFLAGNALPVIILTALGSEHVVFDPDERWLVLIHVMAIQINAVVFGAALLHAQGHPSRLYTFPIPAATLAAWQLIPAMLSLGLEVAFSTAILNQLFNLNWPVWGPALFVAVALAAVQALFWLSEKSVWIVPGMGAVGGVLGAWMMSRYGLFLSKPPRLWPMVTPLDALFMLAVALGAYAVAVRAIGRARCGEALNSERLRAWIERLFDPAPAAGLPFRNVEQAQFWFEWRQKGVLPAMTAFASCLGLLGWLLFNRDSKALYEGFLAGGAILPIGGLVMGLIIGCSGPADGKFEMGSFLATRPMSDAAWARMVLKTAGLNVLFGWLVWLAGYLLVLLALLVLNKLPAELMLRNLGWWYFPGLLIATWLTTAAVTVVLLTGRQTFVLSLACGIPAVLIGMSLFSKFALSPAEQQAFDQGALIVTATVFVLGTLWLFRAAGWPRTTAVYSALGLWALACATLIAHWSLAPAGPPSLYLFLLGLCTLATAPLAAAPLSVAWNRHR